MKLTLFREMAVKLGDRRIKLSPESPPDRTFDALTRLAAQVCQMPIAMLGLMDTKRQWSESEFGLGATEIQRYLDFCIYAILQSEICESGLLIIRDATVDKRFANHPLVRFDPKIRFYAGFPLVNTEGLILGGLSVMDYRPRDLSAEQYEILKNLSSACVAQLELRQSFINFKQMISESDATGKTLGESELEPHHGRENTTDATIACPDKKVTDHPQQINEKNNWEIPLNLPLNRAMATVSDGIVITDPHQADNPIIYANAAFFKISGYQPEEVLGRNCRFLQGAGTDLEAMAQIRAAIAQRQEVKVTLLNYRKDGQPFWNELRISPVFADAGDLLYFVGIQTDVTERKQIEEERDRLFSLSLDMLCVAGFDGYFKGLNPAFEKTLLYTQSELLSEPFVNFVHSEDQGATLAELEKLRTGITTTDFENRYRCQDGTYKWLAWKAVPMVEESLIYATARDVTERKQAEAIRLERLRLSSLEAEIGVILGHSSGKLPEILQHCTDAVAKHLQATNTSIWTFNEQTNQLELQATTNQANSSSQNLFFQDRRPQSDSPIGLVAQTLQPYWENGNSAIQNLGQAQENCPDETQTYFAGYPLIVDERLIGAMALGSTQPWTEAVRDVLGWVANAIAVAIDRCWARSALMTGREALLFRLASQMRNSLDLDTILGTAVNEIRTLLKVDLCQFVWCWLHRNNPSLSVTHEASENPSLQGILENYSPQKLLPLGRKIQNLEILRVDDIADQPQLDIDTQILLNSLGITSQLLIPLQTRAGQLGAIVCSHYSGARPWSNSEVELLQAVVDQLAIAIDQAELFAQTRASALAAQTQATQLEHTLQDLKQTESRLIQTEKMSSLGQMVAGIAHEINNPVNFITGNLSHTSNYIQDLADVLHLYQKHYPHPHEEIEAHAEDIDLEFLLDDLPKMLSSMQMGADRIRQIVLSLRNFSRLDEADVKPVNIHEGIDSTLLILHHRCKPTSSYTGVEIIKKYGELPPVECYPGQLNQVFMNILSNGIDALENQLHPRIITIRTEVLGISETEAIFNHQPSVLIRIQDNGAGMTEEVKKRLFDPFFTTKPVGKGTGLGLSISYQIVVEKHGGILKCLSEPGKGAEFWIQIPLHQQIT